MNRDEFLARVRTAAQSGQRYRIHQPTLEPRRYAYAGGGPDLAARLAEEVTLVGGDAQVVADMHEARVALEALLAEYQPARVLTWQHPVLDELALADLLAARSIDAASYDQLADNPLASQRETMLAADLGITSATFAIAETGSLAMFSAPGRERVASLLPPIHVAIVTRAQILPDLFDLFDRLIEQGLDKMPSNLVLITGPSKTGDLELKLTTGVHGPRKWHVIVVA